MLTHNKEWFKRGYLLPLLLLSVTILGFLPILSVDLRLGKQVLSEWCVYCFGVLFFLRNKYIKWFLMIVFLRYVFAFFFPIYNNKITEVCLKASYASLNTLLVYVLFYEGLINARMNKCRVYDVFCVIGIVQAAFMILQFFGIWIFVVPLGVGIPGLMSNPNMAGSLLAVITPCFFRSKWILAFPVIVFGLILSDTMGAIIPVILFVSVFCYFKIKRKSLKVAYFLSAVLVLIMASFLFISLGSLGSLKIRFDVWGKVAQSMLFKLPLIGYGIGNFKLIFPMIHKFTYGYSGGNGIAIQAHNEYLQCLAEFGLIGCAPIFLYIICAIKKALKNKEFVAISGITIALINSGVNFLFHTVVCVVVIVYFSIIEYREE